MSSACVCHLNEPCFYCEVYSPLKYGVEKVINELERLSLAADAIYGNKWANEREFNLGLSVAYDNAIDKLKAVIEDDHSIRKSGNGTGNTD